VSRDDGASVATRGAAIANVELDVNGLRLVASITVDAAREAPDRLRRRAPAGQPGGVQSCVPGWNWLHANQNAW